MDNASLQIIVPTEDVATFILEIVLIMVNGDKEFQTKNNKVQLVLKNIAIMVPGYGLHVLRWEAQHRDLFQMIVIPMPGIVRIISRPSILQSLV
jgi:hypothetical protein